MARPCHILVKPIGPVCNLDCTYCYYLEKEEFYPRSEKFRMEDNLLKEFIQAYIAMQPGPRVEFSWQGGEPTLMGLDFYRKAVRLQQKYLPNGWTCTNSIQTNGTRLSQEWCTFFREHGFLVGISIDGGEKLHDAYRRDKAGRSSFAAAMRGLQLLREGGVEFNVLCVVNNVNAGKPLQVYRFFKEHQVDYLQFIPLVEHRENGRVSRRSVAPRAYGRFLAAIFDEWFRNDLGRVYVQIFEECFRVWMGHPATLCIFSETCGDALAMEHNGDLYSCDHFVFDEFRLGNMTQDQLQALCASPWQRKFGRAKKDNLPAYCMACDVRFICHGGCPKNRIMNSPSGEPGLNYLCAGYKHFFHHVRPYMEQLALSWETGQPLPEEVGAPDSDPEDTWSKLGRNEPCLCGSGRKYKACCLPRRKNRLPAI